MTMDALGRVLGGLPLGPGLTIRRVTITAASSTSLTVTLPDGSSVTGLPVSGLTYTVGGYGVAFVQQRTVALVLPTP